MNDIKRCTNCDTDKPVSEFYYVKSRASYSSWCKQCQSAYSKANLELRAIANKRHREKIAAMPVLDSGKTCTKCFETMPLDKFPQRSNGSHYSPCLVCSPAHEKRIARTAEERRIIVKERQWRSYGLTDEQMEIARNADKCEACGTTENLNVDHCHNRMIYRGILCRNCNVALGMVKDDVTILKSLISYLEQRA